MQVEGCKTWSLYRPRIQLPLEVDSYSATDAKHILKASLFMIGAMSWKDKGSRNDHLPEGERRYCASAHTGARRPSLHSEVRSIAPDEEDFDH